MSLPATLQRTGELRCGQQLPVAHNLKGHVLFWLQKRCDGFWMVSGNDPECDMPINLLVESPGRWADEFLGDAGVDPDSYTIPLYLNY